MRKLSDELGEQEGRYLDDLTERWRRLPSDERARLVALATDNLLERPASSTREELLRALGPPASYAERLRREAGPAHTDRVRRPRMTWTRGALAVLAVGLVVAGGLFWRWWTDDVVISNNCAGVTEDPRITVETREAAGATEHVVSYVDGAELSVGLCLASEERVEILDVSIQVPTNALFQPEGIRMRAGLTDLDELVPFEPFTLDPRQGDGMVFVYVDGRLADCEDYGEGTAMSIGEASVTYEYHRRRHTTAVSLQTLITFASPSDEQCPRPRDNG
jgi:hypothetical protein